MKYNIIRDTREQTGWMFQEDINFQGTIEKKLDTGDYSVEGCEDIFIIERKGCLSEFVTNIMEKRFADELERLDKIKFAYLILEFEYSDIMRYPLGTNIPKNRLKSVRMTPEFISSIFLSLQYRYPNVKMIFVGKCGKEVAKTLFKKVIKYVKKDD